MVGPSLQGAASIFHGHTFDPVSNLPGATERVGIERNPLATSVIILTPAQHLPGVEGQHTALGQQVIFNIPRKGSFTRSEDGPAYRTRGLIRKRW